MNLKPSLQRLKRLESLVNVDGDDLLHHLLVIGEDQDYLVTKHQNVGGLGQLQH